MKNKMPEGMYPASMKAISILPKYAGFALALSAAAMKLKIAGLIV